MNNENIINSLIKQGITLSSVESFTGGLFASSVVDVSGVSRIYKGSIVSYSNEVKENIVGISKDVIEQYTAVSQEVATQMALKGKQKFNTDICVAFTGYAQKGENKPYGDVYIAIAYHDLIIVKNYIIDGPRNVVRQKAVDSAFELINYVIDPRNNL